MKIRHRSIEQSPENAGKECPSLIDQSQCNEQRCAQDCKVSSWNSWTQCSFSCGGGIQARIREIVYQPNHGGKECADLLETRQNCNSQPCDDETSGESVDCKLTSWSSWTDCSKSCDSGVKVRYRNIEISPENGGQECAELIKEKQCNTQECGKDCHVSSWSTWTLCSKSCGGGIQVRMRSIESQPSGAGDKCPELLETSENCNLKPCHTDSGEGVDCEVTSWSEWTECSKECGGGKKFRYKTISQMPENNGKECPELLTEKDCNKEQCGKDCEVSSWSSWTDCPVTCGGAVIVRTRRIEQQPEGGGKDCPELLEKDICNSIPCDGHSGESHEVVDCEVSSWSTWAECSKSCGRGRKQRYRDIETMPRNGGTKCPKLSQNKPCDSRPCGQDCVVSEWSEVSPCTVTRGGGVKTRTRRVIEEPSGNGRPCPALRTTIGCNTNPCAHAIDCRVSHWSAWTPCSVTCGGGTQVRTRTIEEQPRDGGRDCKSVLDTRDGCNDASCHIHEKVDCHVSSWSEWTDCSRTCDRGRQYRYRSITEAPSNGGRRCPELSDRIDCNLEDCYEDYWCSKKSCKSKGKSKGKSKSRRKGHRRRRPRETR